MAVTNDSVRDGSKVLPLGKAIRRHIGPGDTVHLAYGDARPNAAVLELVRAFHGKPGGLTISTGGLVSVQNALVSENVVDRLIAAFVGENYPAPRPSRVVQRAVAAGTLSVENWTMLSLVSRLVAGALDVPFLPTKSIAGSDLEHELQGSAYSIAEARFGEELARAGVVRALKPDVALVHAVAADRFGNTVLASPYGEGHWGTLAAQRGAIVCAERIVSTEEIRAYRGGIKLPEHAVAAVCEVPFGSHPYGLFSGGFEGVPTYTQDDAFIAEVSQAMRTDESFREWVQTWVYDLQSHDEYLDRLGRQRVSALIVSPTVESHGAVAPLPPAAEQAATTDIQRMLIATSSLIQSRAPQFDVLLAGVGYASLAAWHAHEFYSQEGHRLRLVTEIGMYGYTPQPGSPFVFASQNIPTSTNLTDVMTILGAFMVGGHARRMAVVGAAEVDRTGAINSTWSPDGQFLVGSGGANDVLSGADEAIVVVKHSSGRLPQRVAHVTSPGRKVVAIVTTRGVMVRDGDGEFVLTTVFRRDTGDIAEWIQEFVAETGWELRVAEQVLVADEPTAEDIEILGCFDPNRDYQK